MKNYKKCDKCGDYHWSDEDCLPEYFVNYDEWNEEWSKFNAHSHEDAACKFAEYYNERCDYCLMNETIEVLVKNNNGDIEKYKVGATPSIDYSAMQL